MPLSDIIEMTSPKSLSNMTTRNGKCYEASSSRAGNLILFKRDNEGDSLIALNINSKSGKYVKQRKQVIVLLVFIIVFFYLSLFPLKIWNLGKKCGRTEQRINIPYIYIYNLALSDRIISAKVYYYKVYKKNEK